MPVTFTVQSVVPPQASTPTPPTPKEMYSGEHMEKRGGETHVGASFLDFWSSRKTRAEAGVATRCLP